MLSIEISASGPVFDGRAERACERLVGDAVEAVAEAGETAAVQLMQHYFKHPRPWYWLQITTAHPGLYTAVVHDRDIVYGPWLEGISERNRTSRFKGYHHWRQARSELTSRIPVLVEPVVTDRVAEMRG